MLCKELGLTPNGFLAAKKNNTLKVRDLEKIAEILEVPIVVFFGESIEEYFSNKKENGNLIEEFESAMDIDSETELALLREKVSYLQNQIEMRDLINEILRLNNKNQINEMLKISVKNKN